MSKRFLYAIAIVGSLTFASIPALRASDGLDLRSKIPFAFRAGKEMLPPGTYEIREKPDQPGALVLSSADGKKEEFLLTTELSNTTGKHKSELVFERHGMDRCLKEVWQEGLSVGREIPIEGESLGSVHVRAHHVGTMKKPAKASGH